KFPIGQLDVPKTVTLNRVNQWLKELASYTERLQNTVEDLHETELNKTYREGSWNVRPLVDHIAGSQHTMHQRLQLALTDDAPIVPAFIQDNWATQPDTELPVESSLHILKGLNERIAALGSTLTEEQLDRSFTLKPDTTITVATKIAKLAWHEEHHLAHIKIALES